MSNPFIVFVGSTFDNNSNTLPLARTTLLFALVFELGGFVVHGQDPIDARLQRAVALQRRNLEDLVMFVFFWKTCPPDVVSTPPPPQNNKSKQKIPLFLRRFQPLALLIFCKKNGYAFAAERRIGR